jgi:16S rRNA C1402 N4-methylase RsmH
MNNTNFHIPVMKHEAISHLLSDRDGIYIDATLGYGGHSKHILEETSSKSNSMRSIKILMQSNLIKKNYHKRRGLPLNMDVSLLWMNMQEHGTYTDRLMEFYLI